MIQDNKDTLILELREEIRQLRNLVKLSGEMADCYKMAIRRLDDTKFGELDSHKILKEVLEEYEKATKSLP